MRLKTRVMHQTRNGRRIRPKIDPLVESGELPKWSIAVFSNLVLALAFMKKDQGKRGRKVFGIEPNPMGGVYEQKNCSRQLAIDILSDDDNFALAKSVLKEQLNGKALDLLYSIEVCEHMPPERHIDAAKFLAGLAQQNTKLIF